MRAGWIGAIVFIWIMGVLASSVLVGESVTDNETVTSRIQSTLSWTEVREEGDTGTFESVSNVGGYFEDLWHLVTLDDLALFGGDDPGMLLLYWIVWLPIIATVVFMLIMLFVSLIQRVL